MKSKHPIKSREQFEALKFDGAWIENPVTSLKTGETFPRAVIEAKNSGTLPEEFVQNYTYQKFIESLQTEKPEYPECPISQGLIVKAYFAEDGRIYNEPDLLQWCNVKNVSPLTNLPFNREGVLLSSYSRLMADFVKAYPQSKEDLEMFVTDIKETGARKPMTQRLVIANRLKPAMLGLQLTSAAALSGASFYCVYRTMRMFNLLQIVSASDYHNDINSECLSESLTSTPSEISPDMLPVNLAVNGTVAAVSAALLFGGGLAIKRLVREGEFLVRLGSASSYFVMATIGQPLIALWSGPISAENDFTTQVADYLISQNATFCSASEANQQAAVEAVLSTLNLDPFMPNGLILVTLQVLLLFVLGSGLDWYIIKKLFDGCAALIQKCASSQADDVLQEFEDLLNGQLNNDNERVVEVRDDYDSSSESEEEEPEGSSEESSEERRRLLGP